MVYDFLVQTKNESYIRQNNLQPFEVNVLSKEQTLLEKLASLIRASYGEKHSVSISGKIRHFYDLYYLMMDSKCIDFTASDDFKKKFEILLKQDKEIFDEPKGWQSKSIQDSPLIEGFDIIWSENKVQYQKELSALAYRPIPDETDVAKVFLDLIKLIK